MDTFVARASALMAANGIVFLQLAQFQIEHHFDTARARFGAANTYCILAFGLCCGYGMLALSHRRRIAKILEVFSAGSIVFLLLMAITAAYVVP